jgi:hypothetical protein
MSSTQPVQTVTHEALIEVLNGLSPVALEGVVLLREYRATGQLPSDPERIGAATTQLIQYTESCERAGRTLAKLRPIAATDPDLVEDYPL